MILFGCVLILPFPSSFGLSLTHYDTPSRISKRRAILAASPGDLRLGLDLDFVFDVFRLVLRRLRVGRVKQPVAVNDELVLIDAGVEVYTADPRVALSTEDELRLVPLVEGSRKPKDRGVGVPGEPKRRVPF